MFSRIDRTPTCDRQMDNVMSAAAGVNGMEYKPSCRMKTVKTWNHTCLLTTFSTVDRLRGTIVEFSMYLLS